MPVPSRDPKVIMHIYESEYFAIVAETRRFPDTETGGDLYGTFTHGEMPVIWLASGPGPRARRDHVEFQQDVDFINEWQTRLMQNFGLQYVGTWHSHHRLGLKTPSTGDVSAAQNYARKHDRERTIEIIVTCDGMDAQVGVQPYFYPNAKIKKWIEAQFNFLPNASPVRERLGDDERLFSAGVDWRHGRSRGTPVLSSHGGESAMSETALSMAEDLELPAQLQHELESLENSEIEVEHKNGTFMIVIGLGRNQLLAIAIQVTDGLVVRQVNLVDRSRSTSQDLTSALIRDGILSGSKERKGLLKRVVAHATLRLDNTQNEVGT